MVLSGEAGGRAVVGATAAFSSTERAQEKMKNPLSRRGDGSGAGAGQQD